MRTSFALAKDGDLLTGTYATGHTSIALCSGAELIEQSIKIGFAVAKNELWFNLAYGIDKQNLFYNNTLSNDLIMPMRVLAVKEFLRSFEGVERLDGEPTFTQDGRTVSVKAPCIFLDCTTSNDRIEIGELNVC